MIKLSSFLIICVFLNIGIPFGFSAPPTKKALPRPDPFIVNGDEALPHSLPYMAYISNMLCIPDHNVIEKTCTGALLSPEYAITTAYCCEGCYGGDVVMGANNPLVDEIDQQSFFIDKYIIHPEYKPTDDHMYNDICLIKLEEPVEVAKGVGFIKLPAHMDIRYLGEEALVSGWGKLEHKGHYPLDLMYFTNNITTNEDCEDSTSIVEASNICVETKGNGDDTAVCWGDHGSPIVVNETLVGIVTLSNNPANVLCETGKPVLGMRITSYLNWIKNQTGL